MAKFARRRSRAQASYRRQLMRMTYEDRPVAADVRAGLLKDPGFGKVFTDHMVTILWTQDRGWHDAQVRARAPITLDPAAAVLHYGQEIFEGLKAFNLSDGSIALFRPEQNARRFQASAARTP